MTPGGLVRLAIRVRAEQADVALARLLPLLSAGAEERALGDAVEYALYGCADSLPSESDLRSLAGDALLAVSSAPVADGWETAWHEHLGRVEAGGFAIRPPWVPGEPNDLVIEPGTAFGAGGHPTTRLCLELLRGLTPSYVSMCDWGTGSGVLAIAAARLGFAPVTAVDVDPTAVDLARLNAAADGAEIEVSVGDVTVNAPWAPLVVANLTLPLLAAARFEIPDVMIVSGLLDSQAFAPRGMAVVERRELDGWAAVVLEAA